MYLLEDSSTNLSLTTCHKNLNLFDFYTFNSKLCLEASKTLACINTLKKILTGAEQLFYCSHDISPLFH